MDCLVSVVVPVYNVEKFLVRCINSILDQSYEYIEIILVNDGSTDNCGFICDEYANKDSRIRVIHKENGGLSEARNTGIMNANGDYILFVDSDDFIKPNSIDVLINHAIKYNLDVLEGNAIIEYPNRNDKLVQTNISASKIYIGLDYIVERINENHLTAPVWIKFCKLSFIKENNLYFLKDRLHEDELWAPKLFLLASSVMFIDFDFYHYCIRDNSITQSKNKQKNIISMLNNCVELEDFYNNLKIDKRKKKTLKDYLARQYMATAILGRDNMEFYKSKIDKKFVLRNTKKIKTMVKSLLYIISIPLYIKARGRVN